MAGKFSFTYCTRSPLLSDTASYAFLSCELLSGQYQGRELKSRKFNFFFCLESLCSLFTPVINYNSSPIFLVCSRCRGWLDDQESVQIHLTSASRCCPFFRHQMACVTFGVWCIKYYQYHYPRQNNVIAFQIQPVAIFNPGLLHSTLMVKKSNQKPSKKPKSRNFLKHLPCKIYFYSCLLLLTDPQDPVTYIVKSIAVPYFIPIKFYEKVIQCY